MANLLLKDHIRKDSENFAKVYWNREYSEFVVKFTFVGVRVEEADYFTNDLQDAIGTAKHTLGVK